eukprot:1187420-Prorocentrum_minimum.AAC.4
MHDASNPFSGHVANKHEYISLLFAPQGGMRSRAALSTGTVGSACRPKAESGVMSFPPPCVKGARQRPCAKGARQGGQGE